MEKTISVGLKIENPETVRFLENFVASAEGFYLKSPDDTEQCDLLIIEVSESPAETFQLVKSVLDNGAAGEVFLTSSKLEPEILLQVLRSGAKEFLRQPFKIEEVESAFEGFRKRHQNVVVKRKKNGEIIAVTASKGGAGTSCIAVNLAVALAKLPVEKKVALVELNYRFGETALFLDIEPTHTWAEIDENISRLDTTYLMSALTRHTSGIYILPSPKEFEGFSVINPESVVKTLRLMQTMFDFVVIDISQSIWNLPVKVIELSNIFLLVSALNFLSLATTRKFLDMFRQMGYTSEKASPAGKEFSNGVKVIVNRYLDRSEISLKEAEDILKQKVFWTVPNDYRTTMSAINQGKPVLNIAPKSEVARSFTRLAQSLAHQPEKKKKSLFFNPFNRQDSKNGEN